MHQSQTSFFSGAACGAAMAIAVTLLLGGGEDGMVQPVPSTPLGSVAQAAAAQHYDPQDYFVTGDTSAATLWRRERNGTLTCISINACRRPVGE